MRRWSRWSSTIKNALLVMDDQTWGWCLFPRESGHFAGVWVTPSVEDERTEVEDPA